MKIAPRVKAYMRACPATPLHNELLALLAVARVVKNHARSASGCPACLWWCPEIEKALSRLARVSAPGKEKP